LRNQIHPVFIERFMINNFKNCHWGWKKIYYPWITNPWCF